MPVSTGGGRRIGVKHAMIMTLAPRGCICHGAVATEDTAMTDRAIGRASDRLGDQPADRQCMVDLCAGGRASRHVGRGDPLTRPTGRLADDAGQ